MTQHLIEPRPCTLPREWQPAAPSRRTAVAPPRPRAPSPLLAVGWALSIGLTLSVGSVPARAQASSAEVAADLRMAQDAAPMRAIADAFVARAMAGERDAALAMLSPALVGRIGHDTALRALDAQILPFFQHARQVGRRTTVTRTTDAAGSSGFAFYQWLEPQDGGAARPFTLYVVREQGRLVVANIVPDRLVEGRHR